MLLISSIWVKINKLYRLKSELFSYIVLFTIFTWKVWAEEVGNIDRGLLLSQLLTKMLCLIFLMSFDDGLKLNKLMNP